MVLITQTSSHRAKACYDLFSPVKNLPLDNSDHNPNSQVSAKALLVHASVNMGFCEHEYLAALSPWKLYLVIYFIFCVYKHTSVI